MLRRTVRRKPKKVQAPSSPLAPGTQAPDFRLVGTEDREISPSDYRGRPVILVFYPADWSPVCGDQLALYNEVLPLFNEYQAQVLAISVDGIWCHKAFAESRKLGFPLLSDFEPKGAVARTYGVYDAQSGIGWVHNTFMLDGIEKSVLEGPLTMFPKPVWFPSQSSAEQVAWSFFDLYRKPSWMALARLFFRSLIG